MIRPRILNALPLLAAWFASLLCGFTAIADDLPSASATAPDNFVEIRRGLGGAYYVDAAIKKRYDNLSAEVKTLQTDVQEARISEADAQARIEQLRIDIHDALADINEKEIFVAPATIHTKRQSESFKLGGAGILLIKAEQVEVIGWDEPNVEVNLEKTVLSTDNAPVAAEFDAIKAVHRESTGAEALGQANRQQRAEALAKLTPELFEQHRAFFLGMYRSYARLDPEALARLPAAVAAELRPDPAAPALVQMAERRPFENIVDETIDVVELDGISYQTGNRQIGLEIKGKTSGSSSSVWRRHARLTVYVPKCKQVAVLGGHAGISFDSIDAAVEAQMQDVPSQDAMFRAQDVTGPLVSRGVPWLAVERIAGDVDVIHTEHVGIESAPHYRNVRGQISTPSPQTRIYREIAGRLRGWFGQAHLQIESIGGAVNVRNDFGDTVWVLAKSPSGDTNRIFSECGDIQLRVAKPDTVAAPITAVSEVGNVFVPSDMQTLESAMFTTPGAHDVSTGWHGFLSKIEGKGTDGVLAKFERFRRVPKIVADEARAPGFDLLSRAGTVRILLEPKAK